MRAPQHTQSAHDLLKRFCRGVVTHSNAKIHHLSLLDSDFTPLNQQIQFILKCPDEGVVCPITQELITDIDLNEVQALPLDLDHPDRTAIQLVCQHTFSAFWLIYNWVHNNNVRCPLCRAGPSNARLDIIGMPHHIRVSVQRHMKTIRPVATSSASDAIRAALIFIETVAGKSFLDEFPEQCTQDFIYRLKCKEGISRSTGEELVVLSPAKGKQVYTQFMRWYECDPVKYTSNTIHLDEPADDIKSLFPLPMVLEMLNHVMTVMYGMGFTSRYDSVKHSHIYSVFRHV